MSRPAIPLSDSDRRARRIRERVARDQAALTQRKGHDFFMEARAWQTSAHIPSQQHRAARLCRDRLRSLEFQIDGDELLAGRIRDVERSEAAQREGDAYLAARPRSPGQTGHCEVFSGDLFELGIDGLAARIAALRSASEGETAETYASFSLVLEGFATMIDNAARSVEAAMPAAGPQRRAELAELLETCRHIAHKPPRTFLDAVQLTWFVQMGVMVGDWVGLVCSGRLDRRLIGYYEADIAAGRLTRERALELIEALYFLTNDFQPGGVAYAVMVGGRDAAGRDVTNELSMLCLEAVRRTDLVYPTVGVCWHEDTPEALTDLAVELIAAGHTTPAFFNDKVIRNGLLHYGVSHEEACDYINSTCVEISVCGSSNIWVASPYFSLCGLLLEHMDALIAAQAVPGDYDAFVASYHARLAEAIAEGAQYQNDLREQRRRNGRKPLQSVFTRDCIARGRDIDDGGARYNWVECSFVGLANLADSLVVIRREVYEDRTLTLAGLKALLDHDFEGAEPLRQKFLNAHPKYGIDDRTVDCEIPRLMTFLRAECAKHRMQPDHSPFVPGAFCWIMHQRLGAQCGATPDGRKAGVPFADGAGPAQGREKLGPTAAIQSVTSWDHTPLIGGSAFNMKFSRSLFDNASAQDKLKRLVLTYLRKGGFETQINVVDNSVLRKAIEDPDAYRDLVVRIGGYTDYFTRLSPDMQQEVLQRTEYQAL